MSLNGKNGHLADWSAYGWAVVYARLSDTRSEKEISLDRQLALGHEFFKQYRIPHACATDDYAEPKGHRTGWSEKQRPAYRQMRADLLKRPGKGLIWCVQQARFTRAEDATTVIRNWIASGIDLVFGNELITLDTFDSWLQVHTRSYIHSIESQLGKERMRVYFTDLKKNGVPHERRAVYGLKIIGRGKERKRAVNPKTFPVILAFLEMYKSGEIGASQHAALRLRDLGHHWLTKQNTVRAITPGDLSLTVERLDQYRPFLPAALYTSCVRVRAKRSNHKQNSAFPLHGIMFLRGVIACAKCGTKLYQHHNKVTRYNGYHHPLTLCEHAGTYIAGHVPETVVRARLRKVAEQSPASREKLIRRLTTPRKNKQHDRVRQERAGLEKRLEKLLDQWLDAGFTAEQVNAKRKELEARLGALPDTPPVQPPTMDRETIEQLFADLALVFGTEGSQPERANRIARALLEKVTYDYATGECAVKLVWEK